MFLGAQKRMITDILRILKFVDSNISYYVHIIPFKSRILVEVKTRERAEDHVSSLVLLSMSKYHILNINNGSKNLHI